MAIETDSVMARLVKRVFPRMPDFYALLNGQCATVVEGLEALESFIKSKPISHLRKRVFLSAWRAATLSMV